MAVRVGPQTNYLRCWRPAMWTLFGVLLILPAIAMRFTDDVRWTGSDFIAAAVIFAAVGCSIELVVRLVNPSFLRAALICGVIVIGLAIWADGAVAMGSLIA